MINPSTLFAAAVFLFAYKRFTGDSSFGPLVSIRPGALPPFESIAGDRELNNPSGLTEAQEWEAINRYRRPVGVASAIPSGPVEILAPQIFF